MTKNGPSRSVLFVTRKFPPSVGGMETLANDVWLTLGDDGVDRLIAHGGQNRAMPLWIPKMYLKTLWLVLTGKVDLVLAGDALVYAMLYPFLRLARMRSATMVMGKDVVWDNRFYRAVVHPPLRRAPMVLAISSATRDSAMQFGVRPERAHVVRLGVEIPTLTTADAGAARLALRQRLDVGTDQIVLLAFGRIVKRKGVAWFVREVMPHLRPEIVLLVAGDGEDRPAVESAIAATGLGERVRMVGRVSDGEREELMAGADIMVQPNIKVDGDMEGFGLVTVEAAVRYTTVVAADLEGLRDAVINDVTGYVVPSGDAQAWAQRLNDLAADPERVWALGEQLGAACRDEYSRARMGAIMRDRLGIERQADAAATR